MSAHDIIRLNPDPIFRTHRGRCQAKRQNAYANDHADTDFRCKHTATFRLDGINLCRKHAGAMALGILIREQGARVVNAEVAP